MGSAWYQIVDVTPTVVTLFGGTPAPKSDGVSITNLGGSTVTPIDDDAALRAAVLDVIGVTVLPQVVIETPSGQRHRRFRLTPPSREQIRVVAVSKSMSH